jgi:hypothetical protein
MLSRFEGQGGASSRGDDGLWGAARTSPSPLSLELLLGTALVEPLLVRIASGLGVSSICAYSGMSSRCDGISGGRKAGGGGGGGGGEAGRTRRSARRVRRTRSPSSLDASESPTSLMIMASRASSSSLECCPHRESSSGSASLSAHGAEVSAEEATRGLEGLGSSRGGREEDRATQSDAAHTLQHQRQYGKKRPPVAGSLTQRCTCIASQERSLSHLALRPPNGVEC